MDVWYIGLDKKDYGGHMIVASKGMPDLPQEIGRFTDKSEDLLRTFQKQGIINPVPNRAWMIGKGYTNLPKFKYRDIFGGQV